MSLLSPALLALATALAVPLLLHFLHRSRGRRVPFPALRYLMRTEKDHARRIRSRQLLLLLLRCGAVVLLTLAGARLVVGLPGAAHPPTAVALVVDNSLSSGRVVGGERVLDSLRIHARAVVDQAGPGDLIWVLAAGEPWTLATPLSPEQARDRLEALEVSGARGDLDAALERARGLLEAAPLDRREIHLLSDLQASAFGDEPPELGGLPVVIRTGWEEPGANRFILDARVGAGLPPRANRRTPVTVTLAGPEGDTAEAAVRIVLADQLRGATAVPPGAGAVLTAGPFPQGRVEGYVETDPDDLRADDRFFLSFTVSPPPAVGIRGQVGPFVSDALDVLVEAGRVRRADPGEADVVLLEWGVGLEELAPGQRAVVLPGPDPALRTALARRLREAGVPVEILPAPPRERLLADDATGTGLDGVAVRSPHRLTVSPAGAGSAVGGRTAVPAGAEGMAAPEATAGAGSPPSPPRVWARLEDGSPWLVETPLPGSGNPVVILASGLEPGQTDLPVAAAMIPFVEWLAAGSGRTAGGRRVEAGSTLALPSSATAVETPAGTRLPVDGTHEFRLTGEPGVYGVLAGEEVLERIPVNAPLRESLLAPATREALALHLASGEPVFVDSPSRWRDAVFRDRRGRELWRWLLAAAVLLLVAESWLASSGAGATRPTPPRAAAARAQNA